MSDPALEVSFLPAPLRPISTPERVEIAGDTLKLRAGPRTDWFIDPTGDAVTYNAPALVSPADGPWMLSANVSATHKSTFDAAVLVVHITPTRWAKLCLELSPQKEVMVVSVVTREESDDCNSVVIEASEVHLRAARLGRAFAFHYSLDRAIWHMVRYFSLGDADTVELGFLAQSPTGKGCTATFRDIRFVPELLKDVRSGL